MLNPQNLTAVRFEIINALSIDVRTHGQLDFDASMLTIRHRRTRMLDEITEQYIDTEPVKAGCTKAFKKGHCPLPPNAFSLIRITKAVNTLPSDLFALTQFTSVERCSWSYVEILANAVWSHLQAVQTKKIRKKKTETLKGMVFLAMQNWKNLLISDRELHSTRRVTELLNVNESHWKRDWAPFWEQMHLILTGMEEQALTHVYQTTQNKSRKISSIKKGFKTVQNVI